MTSDAFMGLHRAILKALNETACIGDFLGTGGRIYGEAIPSSADHPIEPVCPSIILRMGTTHCWHSATFDGQEHALVLDIFCKGQEQDLRSLSSAVIERLHDADLPIRGHALISLEFECSETTTAHNPMNAVDQCRMYFKALTISD